MSKGIYCSTSHWIDSSSSSGVVVGRTTFLMMTEWPEREVATSFSRTFSSRSAVLIPSITVAWSMIAPSTMASGGRWKTPNFLTLYSFPVDLTCASLIELDPMSRPISSFDPRSPIAAPGLSVRFVEHLVPVGKLQSQGKDDLAFRVHPTRHPLLHAVDGQNGQPRPPRELRLAHQQSLSDLSDVIAFDFSLRRPLLHGR